MATLVAVTIGPVGCTYRSLYELEALNLNLVGLDQYYEVTFEDECWHTGNVTFTGWTTDATRYIHLKGKNGTSKHKPRLSEHGHGMATLTSVNTNYGSAVVRVSGIGVGGRIIFENLCLYNAQGNSSYGILCDQASAVTIDLIRCLIQTGTDSSSNDTGVALSGSNSNVLRMQNCIVNVGGTGVAQFVTGTLHIYNSTIYARAARGVEFANNAASVIKNSYVHGATACLYQTTGVTITTTATSDASGNPAGLDNVAFSHVNFKSIAKMYGSRELMTGSALIGSGTSIVGQAAPFDYTTDFLGKTIVAAAPDIGALMYDTTESPRIIERHVRPATYNGDYVDLSAVEAANRDLVANNEQWIVNFESFTDAGSAVDFNGWTTDATRYLHLRARDVDGVKYIARAGHAWGAVGEYSFTRNTNGTILTFTSFGASGLIVLENMQFDNTNTTATSKTVSFAQAAGTVRFVSCRFHSGTGARVLESQVGSGGTVQLFNCTGVNFSALATGNILKCQGGCLFKLYHCTFAALSGGNASCIDMGSIAGGELVNCYAKAAGTGKAYENLVGVTMTTCGSSDLTGSVGLLSIVFDSTNFHEATSSYLYPNIRIASALRSVGTVLSGYAVPYNISTDIDGCARPSTPSIGCCDLPSPTCLGWMVKTGIPVLNSRWVNNIAVHTVSDKLYIGCNAQASKPGEIYSLTDAAAAFQLEYSEPYFGAGTNASCAGLVCHLGSMYAFMGSHLPVAKEGAPWTQIAALYLGGTPGNPTASYSSVISAHDGLMYVGPTVNTYDMMKDANGVGPWSNGVQRPRAAAGGLSSGAQTLWEHPDSYDQYYVTSYGTLNSSRSGVPMDVCFFPNSVNDKFARITHDATYVYLYMIDTIRSAPMGAGTSRNMYRALRTDMKFKRVASLPSILTDNYCIAVGNGQVYAGVSDCGSWRGLLYSTDNGGTWSLSSVPEARTAGGVLAEQAAQLGVIWQGRIIFGSSAAGVSTSGIWYSDAFTNAHKLDDFSLQTGDWNKNIYSSSFLSKSGPTNVSGYIRGCLEPKDDSSTVPDRVTRYDRIYYALPSKSYWQWHGWSLDETITLPVVREDGVRYYMRAYRDQQKSYLDGPCLIRGTLIPHSFIHPLETTADEVMTWTDAIHANAFSIEFNWMPTFCPFQIRSDTEIVRISIDATNYIKLYIDVNANKWQREYNAGDAYGMQNPVFILEKVRGGVSDGTISMPFQFSHNLQESAGERWEDPITIQISHLEDDRLTLGIVRYGFRAYKSEAYNTGYTGDEADVIYNGVGYYGEPRVKLLSPCTDTGAGRLLPSGRIGIGGRLADGTNVRNAVYTGERDPTCGQMIRDFGYGEGATVPGMPVVLDDFNRVDSSNLGSNWTTMYEAGGGWTIVSNKAECLQTGYEYWDGRPASSDIIVTADVTVSNNGCLVGLLTRHTTVFPGISFGGAHGYGVQMTQSGAAAASMQVVRWYEGVRYELSSTALSAYTAGTTYTLTMTTSGDNITGTVTDSIGTVLATDTVTDEFCPRPGYNGIYAETHGGLEHVILENFNVLPNFSKGVED